ncbi:hypothetical protein Golax_009132, partial [Gossypium laxum]|nr:hypothetical protein [Gossypium laxum]
MYHVHSPASCAGIVIRDNQGIVLGSKTNMNMHIPSPFVAVALACLQAITLGLDLGFHYVIIEGDSLTVIQKVLSPLHDNSTISAYIQNIKEKASFFRRCSFTLLLRVGNTISHLLAREWKVIAGLCGCEKIGDKLK